MKSFLLKEKNVLLQLLQKKREILESKDVNSETKKNVWEDIHAEFHSHKGVMKREVKQLRKFWENTKLRYKKLYSGSSEANTDIFCMLQDPDYSLPEDFKSDEKKEDNKDDVTVSTSSDVAQEDTGDVIVISVNEEEVDVEASKNKDDIPSNSEINAKSVTSTECPTIKSQLRLKITLPKPDGNNNSNRTDNPEDVNPKEEEDQADKPQIKLRLSRKRKGNPTKFVESEKSNEEESLNSLAELCKKVPTENDIHLFDVVAQTIENDISKNKPIVPIIQAPQVAVPILNDVAGMKQKYPGPVSPQDEIVKGGNRPQTDRRLSSQLFNVDDTLRYNIRPPNPHVAGRCHSNPTKPNEPETFNESRSKLPQEVHGMSTFHYLGSSSQPPPSSHHEHFNHPRLPSNYFQNAASSRYPFQRDVTNPRFPRQVKPNGGSDPLINEQDFLRMQVEHEKAYHAAKMSLIRTDVELFESEHQAKMHLLATQCSVAELQRQYWTKLNQQLNTACNNFPNGGS